MKQMTIESYLQELSSKQPTPGGGGASALTGAAGMALGGMVASLTVGKKRYAAYEADILRLQAEAKTEQEHLIRLMKEDAKAFAPLAKAYGMPKGTPEEKAKKDEVMEAALVKAAEVPLQILKTVCGGFAVLAELAEKGSVLAVSDAGVGAAFLKAAADGAALNVYVNTKLMKNRLYADALNQKTRLLQEQAKSAGDRLYASVMNRLLPDCGSASEKCSGV